MNTKRKSNSVVTVVRLDDTTLQFDVLGAGVLTFDTRKAHVDLTQHAAMHGWTQRISDAAAISRDDETGQPATPQEKLEAMRALVAHYESGTSAWSRGTSITIEAIARVRGWTYEAARKSAMTFAEKNSGGDMKKALAYLRAGKRVAEAITAIRAERAPDAKSDADDALNELGE